MSFIESRDYHDLIVLGRVDGANGFSTGGFAGDIQTTDTPCLLWDSKTAYTFQTSAVPMQIRSTSANDTVGGTGAQTVMIRMLDGDYNESLVIANLNGVTPVPIGTYLHNNQFLIIPPTGSALTNVGNIILETVAGAVLQGFILAGKGIQRSMLYTVPAGKTLIVDNLYFNPGNSGGSNIVVTIELTFRFQDGTVVSGTTNLFSGSSGPLSVTLPTGFMVPEKTSIYYRILQVSANNASFSLNASGRLYTMNKVAEWLT